MTTTIPNSQLIKHNDNVLVSLMQMKVAGTEISVKDVVSNIKLEEDYSKIRDWAVKSEKICSFKDFENEIRRKKYFSILGGDPQTVTEFVDLYMRKNNIAISYKKEIVRNDYKDKEVDELITQKTRLESSKSPEEFSSSEKRELRYLREKLDCSNTNLNVNDISRKLRILAKEMDLHYSGSDIDDVIQEWLILSQRERVMEIFSHISCSKSDIHKGERSNYEWSELASSLFDFNTELDLSLPAKIACVKKYIYQVKRKMRNLTVKNHMMLVLLGPQGTGKTTFMNKLLAPIEELTVNSDFRQITDDRYIDIWDNYAIKTDEMGWASRSDIDCIKNLITTDIINRRIMKTNNSIPIKQKATFIGASNRELNQLVRDETGLRRFIGVRFKANPDWERLNNIDFSNLWKSVDEEAEDPTTEFMDEIIAYQEKSRAETSCELWINTIPETFRTESIPSFELYVLYREWETTHYSKKKMDFDEWQSEMIRLLSINMDLPFIFNEVGTGYEFQFIKSRAKNRHNTYKTKTSSIENIRLERNKLFSENKLENIDLYKMVNENYDPTNDDDVKALDSIVEENSDIEILFEGEVKSPSSNSVTKMSSEERLACIRKAMNQQRE